MKIRKYALVSLTLVTFSLSACGTNNKEKSDPKVNSPDPNAPNAHLVNPVAPDNPTSGPGTPNANPKNLLSELTYENILGLLKSHDFIFTVETVVDKKQVHKKTFAKGELLTTDLIKEVEETRNKNFDLEDVFNLFKKHSKFEDKDYKYLALRNIRKNDTDEGKPWEFTFLVESDKILNTTAHNLNYVEIFDKIKENDTIITVETIDRTKKIAQTKLAKENTQRKDLSDEIEKIRHQAFEAKTVFDLVKKHVHFDENKYHFAELYFRHNEADEGKPWEFLILVKPVSALEHSIAAEIPIAADPQADAAPAVI